MRHYAFAIAIFAALNARADSSVQLARLSLGLANTRATALGRLAWEIDKRTSIDIATEPTEVALGDKRLSHYPLLYASGDRSFAIPYEAELARLRRHLAYGGMLILDSAESRPGGGFDQSARELVAQLFPRATLKTVPPEHVIMKSFYLLSDAPGRTLATPTLEAIEQDGRLVVVYSQNDMAGAWARDPLGRWEHEVLPGGETQRERAFRLGINLVMYALCLDYKDDQVHVPFLLKRRQWKPEP